MRSVLIFTSLSSLICSWLVSRCSQRNSSQQRFPWALQLKEQILKEQIMDNRVFFKMPFHPCPSGCGRFLSADDGHDRCLQCLGFQHAEDAFVDDSCACCGRMSMTSLRSRLFFLKGLAPSAATRAGFFDSSREPPAGTLGYLRVTVRASPPVTSPRTSYSSRSECPVRFPGDFAGPSHGAPSISFGAPSEERMSIAASGDGFTSSEDEGAVGLPPSGVYQPVERYMITSYVTARPPSPPLESHAVQISERCPHPGEAQSCGRRALTTAYVPRRMATPSRDDPADLESIRGSSGEPVCFPWVLPPPAVFFPDRGPPRHGCTGTQLASGFTQVCVSPSEPTRTDTVQAQGGRGAGPAGCAALAHPDLVSWTNFPRDSTSVAHSSEKGPPLSGTRDHMAPASRSVEPPCVAPGRDAADLSGLPPAVVETITQARAPSTRQTFALKWSLFANWCSSRR